MSVDVRDHSKVCEHGFLLRHDTRTGRVYGVDIMSPCPGGEKLSGETEAKAHVAGDVLTRQERTTYTSEWVVTKTTSVPG